MQSPLGPQAQQEEGKSEVQQGTHVDDQESNWRAPGDLKRFKVEDEGGDIDGGGLATWAWEALVRVWPWASSTRGVAGQALCWAGRQEEPG